MDAKVFHSISYGLYLLGVKGPGGPTGCVVNTVFQISAEPAVFAISVNKDNFTNEWIRRRGLFAATVLSQEVDPGLIGTFGYKSGRDVDKNEGGQLVDSPNALPILKEGGVAYLEFAVMGESDLGSHTVFYARLFGGGLLADETPLSYGYYQTVLKGKSPKSAPTYIADAAAEKPQAGSKKGFVCTICGYVYDGDIPFEELPEDWTCPLCGVSKEMFEEREI